MIGLHEEGESGRTELPPATGEASRAAAELERMRTEDALRQSQETYRSLIEEINEVIFSVDADGLITFISPSISRIMGYDPDQMVGRHFSEFIFAEDLTAVKSEFAMLAQGYTKPLEYRVITSTGDARWVLTSSRPRFDNGNFIGIHGVLTDIHQRRIAEESLVETQERYRHHFEMANDAILIIREGVVVDCNSRAVQIFGRSREEILGHTTYDFSPECQPDGSQSREKGPLFVKAALQGVPQCFEWKHSRPDGTFFDAEVGLTIITIHSLKYMQASIRDITDRKLAEAALKESEDRFRTVVTNVPIVIFAVNRDGVFTLSEGKGLATLGLQPGEVVGLSVFDVYRDVPMITESIRRALQGETLNAVVEAGGRVFDAWYSPLRAESGEQHGVIGVATDITERQRAEEVVKASLREKEILLKEIHHRVKNNLQVVSSLFNLQAQTLTQPEVLDALRESHNRVRSMSLIHQLLYQSDSLAAINLGSYIRSLVPSLFRSYAIDRELVSLVLDVEPVPLSIDAAIPAGLILNELIANALKHGFADQHRGRLAVRLHSDGDGIVVLSVADSGRGLPATFDITTSSSLGLQLVSSLTDQLEGTLTIERAPETVFSVQFKLF